MAERPKHSTKHPNDDRARGVRAREPVFDGSTRAVLKLEVEHHLAVAGLLLGHASRHDDVRIAQQFQGLQSKFVLDVKSGSAQQRAAGFVITHLISRSK